MQPEGEFSIAGLMRRCTLIVAASSPLPGAELAARSGRVLHGDQPMITIKTLLTGALLSMPIAAQAAPVPIFESLDGFGAVDETFADGLSPTEFDPFEPDFIQFATRGFTSGDVLNVFADEEGLPILLSASTILRTRTTRSDAGPDGEPTPDFTVYELGGLSGPDAGLFGPSAYLRLDYFDEGSFVVDDGEVFTTGQLDQVDARIYATAPSPIPVPATLPLLTGALGIGALVLRRRA